jgi:hypothetical protein
MHHAWLLPLAAGRPQPAASHTRPPHGQVARALKP